MVIALPSWTGGWARAVLLVLAAGVAIWPARPRRLPDRAGPSGDRGRPGRWSVAAVIRSPGWAALVGGAVVGAPLGPLPGAAAAMAAFTGVGLATAAARNRRRRIALTQLTAGLRLLTRELRSGAGVPQACAAAAAASDGVAADLLSTVAGEARLGLGLGLGPGLGLGLGYGGARPVEHGSGSGEAAAVGRKLRAVLRLSGRCGVPAADLVAAYTADLQARTALAERRAGEVAGPQLSGYLLAALPGLGLVLGAGMGADPLAVLLRPGLGQVLLVAGVLLSCLGLGWISRIVRT